MKTATLSAAILLATSLEIAKHTTSLSSEHDAHTLLAKNTNKLFHKLTGRILPSNRQKCASRIFIKFYYLMKIILY